MTSNELQAIRDVMRDEFSNAKTDIMQNVSVLMDAHFGKQFDLLSEKLDAFMERTPSEEDLNIIDDHLQEHDDEIRILRHDVNALKRAQ